MKREKNRALVEMNFNYLLSGGGENDNFSVLSCIACVFLISTVIKSVFVYAREKERDREKYRFLYLHNIL
jgi:hypothetical protein